MKNKWLKVMDTVSKLHIEKVEKINQVFNFVVFFQPKLDGTINAVSLLVPYLKNEKEKEMLAHIINEKVRQTNSVGVLLCIDANMWSVYQEKEINIEDIEKVKQQRKPIDVIVFILQTPTVTYLRGYSYQKINNQLVVNRLPIVDDHSSPDNYKGIFKIQFPTSS